MGKPDNLGGIIHTYQNYDPTDERAFAVYEFAQRHHLPVMIHQATTFPSTGHLKYALRCCWTRWRSAFPRS